MFMCQKQTHIDKRNVGENVLQQQQQKKTHEEETQYQILNTVHWTNVAYTHIYTKRMSKVMLMWKNQNTIDRREQQKGRFTKYQQKENRKRKKKLCV